MIWICRDCGFKNTPWKRNVIETILAGSTFHEDTCDWCGVYRVVTDAKDFGIIFKNKTYKDENDGDS